MEPSGQSWPNVHGVIVSDVLQKEPAGHTPMLMDPSGQYDDIPQAKATPFLQYFPAGHTASTDDPVRHRVPSAQAVGVDVFCVQ